MRQASLAVLILLICTTMEAHPHGPQDSPTFSVAVNLIKVPITVYDTHGETVQDLRREDFILYEDQARQQIRSFGVDHQPVSIVLLLDSSATVEKELARMKESAESFDDALSHDDRVSVITFGDEVILQQDWTSDTRQVRKALRRIKPGLRTALYDGMYSAAHEQLRDVEGRKAIILLTDCLNNQSTIGFEDAALSVIQSQATLYVISKTVIVRQDARKQRRVVMLEDIYRRLFGDDNYIEEFFQKREQEMIDLAEKTGGRCYFPSDYDQIPGVYQQVASELKNQYFLTYISSQGKSPNSYHNISIEYLPPSSKLIYRRGYYYEPRPVHKRSILRRDRP